MVNIEQITHSLARKTAEQLFGLASWSNPTIHEKRISKI
jgi:hypothetical protein